MARLFDVEPLPDTTFGAVVRGIKVADLDEPTFRALYDTWLQYALLILPDQHLQRDQQIAFAKRFGPLEFEMTAISNVRSDGTLRLEKDNDDVMKILKGNMGWHHDSTYMPVQAKGAVFSAEEVPSVGGRTGFADMRAAYDALDPAIKAQHRRPQRLSFAALQPGQARPSDQEARRRVLAATACMTGRCRSGRWSRPIPRPAASRCWSAAMPTTFPALRRSESDRLLQRADRLRLPAAAHLPPRLDAGRRGGVGQSLPDAPGDALGHDPAPHHVAQPHRRRSGERVGAAA